LGQLVLEGVFGVYFVIVQKTGLAGILYGSLIANIVFALLGLYLTRRQFNWKISRKKIKALLLIAAPLAPTGILFWIMDSSNRYFLAYYKNIGAGGLFSIGTKFASIVLLITTAFRLANTPFQFKAAEDPRVKAIYAKILTYYLTITLLVATGLSLFSREIVMFFTPPAYLNAYRIIGPLTISFILFGLYQIIGMGILLGGKTYYLTYALAIGAIANVVLNTLLIPNWSIMGAAIATPLAYMIGMAFLYFWSQTYYPVPYEYAKIARIIPLSLMVIATGYIITAPSLLLVLLLKSALFCMTALAFYFTLEYKERSKIRLFLSEIFGEVRSLITQK
jgi:O-antigen/teichoic acid export membrane protein